MNLEDQVSKGSKKKAYGLNKLAQTFIDLVEF
jgi:hypothetical protein